MYSDWWWSWHLAGFYRLAIGDFTDSQLGPGIGCTHRALAAKIYGKIYEGGKNKGIWGRTHRKKEEQILPKILAYLFLLLRACHWQRKAKFLSKTNYCSLFLIPMMGQKWLALVCFSQVRLWRSTLLHTQCTCRQLARFMRVANTGKSEGGPTVKILYPNFAG